MTGGLPAECRNPNLNENILVSLLEILLDLTCDAGGSYVVWEETFLPVEQLLGGNVNLLGLAVHHGFLPTLGPRDLLTVRPGLGGAVGGGEDLAGEGVRHLGPSLGLRLVVPQLLLGAAGHLGAGRRSVNDYI